MDFETMVALKFLTSPKTANELRAKIFKFYDNGEEADTKISGILLHLEQALLISSSGLPAKYVATTAGTESIEQFELGIARYRSVFGGIMAGR